MYELYAAGRLPWSRARRAIVDSAWSLETGSQRSRALPRAVHAGTRRLHVAAAAVQHNARARMVPGVAAAAFQHNARTHSGPPSTGITVTMDGGVADTARANTTA